MIRRFLGQSLLTEIVILLTSLCIWGCSDDDDDDKGSPPIGYRQEMRNFVQDLSAWGRGVNSQFIIVPQNGQELLTDNGEDTGTPVSPYINAIHGVGREDLFYGYNDDNVPTPASERDYMLGFLNLAERLEIEAMVIDYCWNRQYVDDSYSQSAARGYISFAADHRELDNIPVYPANPYNAHSSNVTTLKEAKNFLYVINPATFPSKDEFLTALKSSNYDILVIDLFYNGIQLTASEIASLKVKPIGGTRLVLCYLSIGEAEDYRYYWQANWKPGSPSWLLEENPDWPGNYKVRYWEPEWKKIIYGNNDSYLKKILDSGFDGAYLDLIDAFEYFERSSGKR